MNYEFHVGDYVETVDGWVGYIDYWKIYWNEVRHEHTLLLRGISKKDGKELPMNFNFVCSDIPRRFNRIGKYTFGNFTNKEKKKIEQLEKDLPVEGKCKDKKVMIKQYLGDSYYTIVYNDKMIDKINELVDAVNKLMDKEDEE